MDYKYFTDEETASAIQGKIRQYEQEYAVAKINLTEAKVMGSSKNLNESQRTQAQQRMSDLNTQLAALDENHAAMLTELASIQAVITQKANTGDADAPQADVAPKGTSK